MGCNALTVFAAVWKAEDTASQFGAMHNLDAVLRFKQYPLETKAPH